jgi:GDYXXLXY protein
MSRKTIIILAIIIQLAVLLSFVGRYEVLKHTGTTVYIPLRGYDPTDILRGDYVNLSYELPYSGNTQSYSSEQQYLIPIITGTNVTGIEKITTTQPESGIYFQIRNGWEGNTLQNFTIKTISGKELKYT